MRRFTVSSLLLLGCAAMVLDAPGSSAASTAKKTDTQTTQYLIESPHTPEECMKALDDVSAMGPKSLARWHFGCMAGEHTGWAIVTAATDQAALEMVPASLRDKATVHKINKFTPGQIKEMHEKMH